MKEWMKPHLSWRVAAKDWTRQAELPFERFCCWPQPEPETNSFVVQSAQQRVDFTKHWHSWVAALIWHHMPPISFRSFWGRCSRWATLLGLACLRRIEQNRIWRISLHLSFFAVETSDFNLACDERLPAFQIITGFQIRMPSSCASCL